MDSVRALVVGAALVAMLECGAIAGTYGGGSGTGTDPYRLSAPEHIDEMRTEPNDWSEHFILTADIDLGGHIFRKAVIAWDTELLANGFQGVAFTGHLDGNGHAVRNLSIEVNYPNNGEDYLGLFGRIVGGSVEALTITGAEIVGGIRSYNVAAIAGSISDANVHDCYVVGEFEGQLSSSSIGGVVGYCQNSVIERCWSDFQITTGEGTTYVGGLIGYSEACEITGCVSQGVISCENDSYNVGGLVGGIWASTVTTSNSSCSVMGTDHCWRFGALAGDASRCDIEDCYSSGPVSVHGFSGSVGGLVGSAETGTIRHCYSTSTVTGQTESEHLGGLVGIASSGSVSDCRASGSVLSGVNTDRMGGLVGSTDNSSRIVRCRFEGSVRGGTNSDHVGGLVGDNSRTSWIVSCHSAGTVHAEEEVGGLVGDNNGSILYSDSVSEVSSEYDADRIGGLVGLNQGNGVIAGCSAEGDVAGDQNSDHVGGFVGRNDGTIMDCYSHGDSLGGEGSDEVGGFVGRNQGAIYRCYSTGTVVGDDEDTCGGFVGWHESGDIVYCFWNSENANVARGTGLMPDQRRGAWRIFKATTQQMKRKDTYTTSEGWVFAGDAGGAGRSFWTIDDGHDYPRLVCDILGCGEDGGANFAGYSVLADNWRMRNCDGPGDCGGMDIDFSGAVDWADLSIMLDWWLAADWPCSRPSIPSSVIEDIEFVELFGDFDSMTEVGETVGLRVTLKNIWKDTDWLTATLSCDHPDISVINAMVSLEEVIDTDDVSNTLALMTFEVVGSSAVEDYDPMLHVSVLARFGSGATIVNIPIRVCVTGVIMDLDTQLVDSLPATMGPASSYLTTAACNDEME